MARLLGQLIFVALLVLFPLCFAQAQIRPDILSELPTDNTDWYTSFSRGFFDILVDISRGTNYEVIYERPDLDRDTYVLPEEVTVATANFYSTLDGVWYLTNVNSGSAIAPPVALVALVLCFM
jgi:hypothetical protein